MSFKPRVLFLDAYDSFSNNIIALLEAQCNVHVTKVYIDAVIPHLDDFLTAFAAIVCGPGPGRPTCPKDVGLFKDIWALSDDSIIPVLGICLGFQSLAHELGASVIRLPQPRHGIRTCVTTSSTSIFEGLSEVHTVQYHSLHAVIGEYTGSDIAHLWRPSVLCPELQPLAWDFSGQAGMDSKFQKNPYSILMAIKHKDKPFYGVQFHPESICSDPTAQRVVANWWRSALEWLSCNRPSRLVADDTAIFDRFGARVPEANLESGGNSQTTRSGSPASFGSSASSAMTSDSMRVTREDYPKLISVALPIGALTILSICNILDFIKEECIILDSELRQLPQLGESSIIGIVLPHTKKITYSVGTKQVYLQQGGNEELVDLRDYDGNIFSFVKAFMSKYKIEMIADRAFCGGLMGYITYEAGLETIGVPVPACSGGPDICFAFVERSILIEHKQHTVYVQFLQTDEHDYEGDRWVSKTAAILEGLSKHNPELTSDIQPPTFPQSVRGRTLPIESEYKAKIAHCQEQIDAGNSYELCLTDQTSVSLGDNISSWDMFVNLRQLNPAPFAAYLRLGPLTLLSTSPERFMNWSRFQVPSNGLDELEPELFSTCQFRPIKGTVKKDQVRSDGSVHRVNRLEATALLKTQKEQAENLMIVDLIRHDLYGVCRDVRVEDLMVVEEYESVFQLVSVIEGRLFKSTHSTPSTLDETSGIDCLAASLPPGSMTGAPKRRSCQLLREIEDRKPRSVYSGILGYICVTGKGDFSVVIRSLYKWDVPGPDSSEWNIGAGGAITTLSTEDDEWEEMLTKLQSTYRLFVSK
ncbi:para-aminobenzoate synthase, (PABA) [Xylographa bjoerkii]|nr:para-aminobenzoate synthase, (PABA) [Xylographa bjoerkii]MCJ1396198.1 para-aminobenzoate synthase, (PABA) [Xylographa bjoerkii]